MVDRDERYDVIVVGSGAAGLAAASVAAAEGLRVLVLEQSDLVGGTTAISGGMMWIPANHKMAAAGRMDTIGAAESYLQHAVPATADRNRLRTFLLCGDEAIQYLEANTALRVQPVTIYPDYYPNLPGATAGGRVLEPVPFDGAMLGKAFRWLRPPLADFMLFGGMMVSRADIPHLRRAARSWRSAARVVHLITRYALQRLRHPRGTTLYLGNALVARLLKSILDRSVDLKRGTTVRSLLVESGRVAGVAATGASGDAVYRVERGVILATGGFSHDTALRQRHLPAAARTSAAVGSPHAPCGARLAEGIGARIGEEAANRAFWAPLSIAQSTPGTQVFPHTVTDRGKPGLIAVDRSGRRFTNEARSYHDFVLAQLQRGEPADPAWLICDRTFLWKYGLGRVKPFTLRLAPHLRHGYLRTARTIEALSSKLDVPLVALVETIATYNQHSMSGEDPAFGRGGDIYQRHLGDAEHRPNPCVAPIVRPPFYAVAVYPGDLGTAAGLHTDSDARVLGADGAPIAGLYACGNDAASVMGGAYPGPGITLGPALVFGYLAGRHVARQFEQQGATASWASARP